MFVRDYSHAEQLAFKILSTAEKQPELKPDAIQRLVKVYSLQNKFDEAVGFCGSLVELCKEQKDWTQLSNALLMMGNIFLQRGNQC
jgi:hypothetical protein